MQEISDIDAKKTRTERTTSTLSATLSSGRLDNLASLPILVPNPCFFTGRADVVFARPDVNGSFSGGGKAEMGGNRGSLNGLGNT